MAGTAKGPLDGVRVLELAHIMAGPVCGLMLADLGADVIKIEKINGGDDSRRMVPPVVGDEAAAFLMMNRNKRGIALDLKSDAGKDVLKRMVSESDILIENYRLGMMDRLGIGYDVLRDINPALVYCEISGFGRTGPLAEQGGFDLVAQGMSGLMSITGEGPGRPPVKVGAPVSDITAGILGALGCVSAYVHAKETGTGQRVDTSLFEAAITHTYWQSAIALATGVAPGPMGSRHPLNGPYQAIQTSDGWVNIGAANQRTFERLLDALGLPELAKDPRFSDNERRMAAMDDLVDILTNVMCEKSTAHWLDAFAEAGLPAGPVLDVNEMHAHPQTLARDMVTETQHPTSGSVKTLGLPIKLSDTPGGVRKAAPTFGEDTRSVLAEFGFSSDEIEGFVQTGIVHG